jgi:hypothetical protein
LLRHVALFAAFVSVAAFAQTNTFDIQSGSRIIGKDSFTLGKIKQGYKLDSHPTSHFGGTDTSLQNEFKYDESYAFLVGSSADMVNQIHISYTPAKARTSLVIGSVQAGVQDSRFLDIKPDFTVMPAYDAGAAQVMLLLAVTHPTATNLYNVVVPGAARSGTPSAADGAPLPTGPRPGNFAYDPLWTKGPATTGTLDGKPIQLQTYVLTAGKSTWTFFADESNTLLQLDVSALNASYIRSKFKLDAPK